MGSNKYVDGKFYEVLYDYSFIDQSYEFSYPENKNNIHNQSPTLIPVPGFCFQGRTQQNKPAYINICHAIELPNCNVYNSRIHTSNREDQSVLGFNLYLDDERVERDNGKICICYDAIIQTEFMDAVLSHSRRDQRLYYLYQTACKAIFDRYNIHLEREVEVLKKFYHGTMPEPFKNIFKRIGVMSKSDEVNNKEPYFSDPFTVPTTVRRFNSGRKPEFDVKNPSIDYEFRQFPAEDEFKGFMLQAILPYFSFLDPRDIKVFVSERKLLIRESKTNHQFYFDLPNSVSVMDCRIHFHDGKITVYLPRVNPASCRTLGQYRRRPDPPRIVAPNENPPAQTNLPQIRPHSEVTSETTHSQIIPSQIAHLPSTSSQMSTRHQFPPHYQAAYSNIDSHQVVSSHLSHSQTIPHTGHFQTAPSHRNHFQSNTSRLNQLQDCSSQMSRLQGVHYQLPPSQNSQHISPPQMGPSQMAPSRMGHFPPMPSQLAHNRVNPLYMGRYQANAALIDRHQANSHPLGHQPSSLQMNHHQVAPSHIGHHQSAPRMEQRTTAPPQIGHQQASSAQMNQLQMASSHLAQLQTVLSRQVHLQEAPSLLARLQATLSQVENLKATSLQQADQQPCLIQSQNIQAAPTQKAQLQNSSQEKDPVQTNTLQIADLQAALNEISDLQKALLEAANFQVANLQAAILQITTPHRDEPQTLPPRPADQQVGNPQTPHSQTPPDSDNLQTPFPETPYTEPTHPPAETTTPTSSP